MYCSSNAFFLKGEQESEMLDSEAVAAIMPRTVFTVPPQKGFRAHVRHRVILQGVYF